MTIVEMLDKLTLVDKVATRGPWGFTAYEDTSCMRTYGVYAPDVPGRAGEPTRGNLTCQPIAYAEHDRAPEVRDEDMDAIVAMRNALPALLAWAREATTLLKQVRCIGGSRCWYGGVTGDMRVHHADDCLVTLRNDLLARDVEVAQ